MFFRYAGSAIVLIVSFSVFAQEFSFDEARRRAGDLSLDELVSTVEIVTMNNGELAHRRVERDTVNGCYDQYYFEDMGTLYDSVRTASRDQTRHCLQFMEDGETVTFNRNHRQSCSLRGRSQYINQHRLDHSIQRVGDKLHLNMAFDYKAECSNCAEEDGYGAEMMRQVIQYCKGQAEEMFARYDIVLNLEMTYRPFYEQNYDENGRWTRSVASWDNASFRFAMSRSSNGITGIYSNTWKHTRLDWHPYCEDNYRTRTVNCHNPNICKNFMESLTLRMGLMREVWHTDDGCATEGYVTNEREPYSVMNNLNGSADWDTSYEFYPRHIRQIFNNACSTGLPEGVVDTRGDFELPRRSRFPAFQ